MPEFNPGTTESISQEAAAEQILNSPGIELIDPREEPETEVTEEETEVIEEKAEPEKEAEETEPETEVVEIDPEVAMFDVEIRKNGELVETETLSLTELKNGYKRNKDYSTEMQALSTQKNEARAEIQKAVETERANYKQALETHNQLVWEVANAEFASVDMNKLADEDPAEFVRARNRMDNINKVIQGIHAEQQRISAQEAEHIQTVVVPKAQAEIQRDIPNWSESLQESLVKAGSDYGYTTEELNNIIDPRAIKVLHDAYQYKQIKAQKPAAEKKVVGKPRVVKPGTKQSTKPTGESIKRARKSGRVDDAAMAILETQF